MAGQLTSLMSRTRSARSVSRSSTTQGGTLPLAFLITAALLLMLPVTGQSAPPPGDTPEKQGEHIFITQDDMDLGYRDAKAGMTMTLLNAAGQQSRRQMMTLFLEVLDDGDKTLITFKFPRTTPAITMLEFQLV